jgi:hypothetical protein
MLHSSRSRSRTPPCLRWQTCLPQHACLPHKFRHLKSTCLPGQACLGRPRYLPPRRRSGRRHRGSHPQSLSAAPSKSHHPAAFRYSAGPVHQFPIPGNRALTPLRPAPLMPPTFSSRRHNFDWRGFITPGVKQIVLICPGVFLLQAEPNLMLRKFADRQRLFYLICGGV